MVPNRYLEHMNTRNMILLGSDDNLVRTVNILFYLCDILTGIKAMLG